MAVDPPRDVDQVLAAARRGVRITHVVETHLHNDYVTGGLELARITGAAYLVPTAARVSFTRVPVADGDTVTVGDGLELRAVATPGRPPHHTSCVPAEQGRPVAAFTGWLCTREREPFVDGFGSHRVTLSLDQCR